MSEHLTVKQLSEQTGMPYDSLAELLRRYSSARDLLNPKRERGIWVYPGDQLPQFFRIAKLHKSGVSLSSIAKGLTLAAQEANVIAESNPPVQLATQEQMNLLTSALSEAIRRSLPPPDDQLLSLTEAHEAFPLVPLAVLRSLRLSVGRRQLLRRSDVLRWIQNLKSE